MGRKLAGTSMVLFVLRFNATLMQNNQYHVGPLCISKMEKHKNILLVIAVNYAVVFMGWLVLEFSVGAPIILLVSIAAAATLSSFAFVRCSRRYMSGAEAFFSMMINGLPLFILFSFNSGGQYDEPYTGALLRVVSILMGLMIGFGFYVFMYFSRNIWPNQVKNG